MSYQELLQQMTGVTLVMLLLVGCGAPAATPIVIVVTATPQPTPTPVPPTATPQPTPTPVPPTPTLTPVPTPTINRFAHLSGVILLADHDRGNTLLAVAADGSSERRFEVTSRGDFTVSPDSATILHALKGTIAQVNLSTGTETLIVDLGDEADISDLRFSPDGKKLAFTDYGTLYVMDLASGQKDQVYSSAGASYYGGLKAYCEIQYLMWVDESKLIFYVGRELPNTIFGNAERRIVSCSDRTWREVEIRTGETQQIEQVSLFTQEFQRQLEDNYDHYGQLSPDGLKYAYDDWVKGSLYIVDPGGKVQELGRRMSLFRWSYDSRYLIGVPRGSEFLRVEPADLSEPPMIFRECWCTPLLWLPPTSSNQ